MNIMKGVYAIIPARGGSKRIKKKNIKLFNGKPMIFWIIKKILFSKLFDKIIVSTEDKEIKKVSYNCGADIVINRPPNLSDDRTITHDVIKHAIKWLEEQNHKFNSVFCVYPCTPLLEIKDFKRALIASKGTNKFIYPVLEYSHPIQRALLMKKNKNLKFVNEMCKNKRTQDFKKTFHDAGQFYLAKKKTWMSNKNMHSYSRAIILPNWRIVDIDNNNDWKKAESIFSTLKLKQY